MKYLICLIAFFPVVFFSLSSAAQDNYQVELEIKEALRIEDDEYREMTYENLSKLYWAIGKMDFMNEEHIDNYLLINECELYKRLRANDFEWGEVRKATRDMIRQKMVEFPTQFEIIIPIYLEAYDIRKEEFPLTDESQIVDTIKVDFSVNFRVNVCDRNGDLKDYPSNLVFIFNRPLTLKSIPMQRELAELYLAEARARYDRLPSSLRAEKYQRLAYLRVKARVVQYKETVMLDSRYVRAVVFATLDGYEVYADDNKLNLLYKQDYEDQRRARRVRRARIGAEAEEASGSP